MDVIIRLIENIVQGVAGIIQSLLESGNLGYLIPVGLLFATTWAIVNPKNRMTRVGYLMGWVVALTVMGLYQQSNGDSIFQNLLGTAPKQDLLIPGFFGVIAGVFLLLPFSRMKSFDSQPLVIAIVTFMGLMLLFLTWRASASMAVMESSGAESLVAYRKRYVGVFALTFGISILAQVLITAANSSPPAPPPQSPPAAPPPAAPPPQS